VTGGPHFRSCPDLGEYCRRPALACGAAGGRSHRSEARRSDFWRSISHLVVSSRHRLGAGDLAGGFTVSSWAAGGTQTWRGFGDGARQVKLPPARERTPALAALQVSPSMCGGGRVGRLPVGDRPSASAGGQGRADGLLGEIPTLVRVSRRCPLVVPASINTAGAQAVDPIARRNPADSARLPGARSVSRSRSPTFRRVAGNLVRSLPRFRADGPGRISTIDSFTVSEPPGASQQPRLI
jgi:hypothetical protein